MIPFFIGVWVGVFITLGVMRVSMYLRFLIWLHKFEEFPNYNRFGAGLYQLLWTHYCGYDWANAWDCAAIYWFNRKPKSYGSRQP